ncbi:MAG TPA: TonB-dependent receptor [Verrucomicrobiae bacterium]|nr:TonB-dependent receptor [Verrucomicrobiae bacterium]
MFLRKFWFWALVILFTAGGASNVFSAQLSGQVLDENQAALADVRVAVPALHRIAFTDSTGRFLFNQVPAGVFTVELSRLGYKTETRQVNLAKGDTILSIQLDISPLELPPLTVTATPQPTDVLSSPLSVSVVSGRELERSRGETVMQTIENSPGVATFSTGAGIAKPVIRGLTSQRVLVVSDGVRQEGQQWGDEHGPEIDALDVEKIEVVRGPNSVLYGSDALGGVVNIIKPEVPCADEGAPPLAGEVLLNGFSNNRQEACALALYGASGVLGYRGNFSLRDGRDISTPTGKLFNSGEREINGSGALGTEGDWGSLAVDYSHFGQELEIHEDPAEDPTATPFQRIRHDKVHLHSNFPMEKVRLEINGGWQRNHRTEFEDESAADTGLNLVLNTINLEIRAHHQPLGKVFGTVGFSLMNQDNNLSNEPLIPEFTSLNLAGFVYEEARFKDVTISAGVRVDTRSMDVDSNPDLGVLKQSRDYDAVTGTAGAVWHMAEPLAFAASIGRGWRSPTAFELFANGVHEGTVRFEVGDSTIEPEESFNVDFSLRYATARLQAEATVFRNRITGFIFPSPTGVIHPVESLEIFQYRQSDATFLGAELLLKGQVTDWLVLSAGADFVRGTNDRTDDPLPFIPAHRLKLGARFIQPSWRGLSNLYISLGSKVVAKQERVEPNETPSKGYALFDAGAGAEIPLGSRRAHLDLAVENLLDKAYRDHLSRYKNYALNPGWNFSLKLSVPFTLVP